MIHRLVLATRNPGKVAEIQRYLHDTPVHLLDLSSFPGAPEVQEDEPTLEGNARKKAAVLHEFTGLPCLADDTGLEVKALGGRPGVHSARYAGPTAGDTQNRKRLLEEMAGARDRTARFRTVFALAAGGEVHLFEGTCSGVITEDERGEGGFGYDSVFVPEGSERTFAEMSRDEKNAISHRGKALRKLVEYLKGNA